MLCIAAPAALASPSPSPSSLYGGLDVAASVLTFDDPCLGAGVNGDQCGAELLQRSGGRYKRLAKAPPEVPPGGPPEAELRSAEATLPQGAGNAEAPVALALPALTPHVPRHAPAAPTSLLAGVRRLVTQVKLSGRTAPEVRNLAEEYAQMLEAQAVPSIQTGHEEHQRLMAAHAQSFERCDTDLEARLETGLRLLHVHDSWRKMHTECRAQQARLEDEVTSCSRWLGLASDSKLTTCGALNASDASAGRDDAELVEARRKCQDSTRAYVDQWSICAEGERFHEAKCAECDSVEQSQETANCARASQVSGVCDMYDLCRAGMSLAYTSAKEAARAWQRYHKAELIAVATARCFADALNGHEAGSEMLGALERCEQLVANTTLFDLDYQDVPVPVPCTPVTDSPCVRAPASRGPPSERPASAPEGVTMLEAAREGVPAAVSFMQEGLERVSVSLPGEVHEALFGALVLPIAMILVFLTGAVAVGRCLLWKFGHQGQAEGTGAQLALGSRRARGADTLPLSSASGGNSPPGCQHWLCPELIVPRNSRCIVVVPLLSTSRTDSCSVSALVTDKVGQPLFKVSMTRTSSIAGHTEQLAITRQDGTPLAGCVLTLPQAGAKSCRILHPSGQAFATMRRDSGQVSWLSRLLRRATGEASANLSFVPEPPHNWQLQVQGSLTERRFRLLDGGARAVASAELSSSSAFGQCRQDCFRVEVLSELDADLGLVTLVVLAADRVLSQVPRDDARAAPLLQK